MLLRVSIYWLSMSAKCAAATTSMAFLKRPPENLCCSAWGRIRDRKSTRLNSSHDQISYAVFCLKKKKKRRPPAAPRRQCRRPRRPARARRLHRVNAELIAEHRHHLVTQALQLPPPHAAQQHKRY